MDLERPAVAPEEMDVEAEMVIDYLAEDNMVEEGVGAVPIVELTDAEMGGADEIQGGDVIIPDQESITSAEFTIDDPVESEMKDVENEIEFEVEEPALNSAEGDSGVAVDLVEVQPEGDVETAEVAAVLDTDGTAPVDTFEEQPIEAIVSVDEAVVDLPPFDGVQIPAVAESEKDPTPPVAEIEVFERSASANRELIKILERNGVEFEGEARSVEEDVAELDHHLAATGTATEWTTVNTNGAATQQRCTCSSIALDIASLDSSSSATTSASTSAVSAALFALNCNNKVYDLFSSSGSDDESRIVLFAEDDKKRLYHQSSSSFMSALRQRLDELASTSDELVLFFPDLGISIAEVSCPIWLSSLVRNSRTHRPHASVLVRIMSMRDK